MKKKFSTLSATCLLVFGMVGTANAILTSFSISPIGFLGGSNHTRLSLNDFGQVVGAYTQLGTEHAFLYEKGTLTEIGTLGGNYSIAVDINNLGQVIGQSATSSGEYHGFLYKNGTITDIGTLGGNFSITHDINDSGQIVGRSNVGYSNHAFLHENGTIKDITNFSTSYSEARFINNYGMIAGDIFVSDKHYAFLYEKGTLTEIGTLGGNYSTPVDINNLGQVIGQSATSSGEYHGFLYKNGTITDIGTLGGTSSDAYDINDSGQIVGGSYNSFGAYHGYLFENGTITDIGTLGGRNSGAQAINDSGQIVGWSDTSLGGRHGFLWQNGIMTDINNLIDTSDIGVAIVYATAINNNGQILALASDGMSYLLNPLTAPDNCINTSNPDQTDIDGDGLGDVCDPQTCGNGIIEHPEECDDGNVVDSDGCASICVLECLPGPESCDGTDNDCDTLIDEDYSSQATSCGIGACYSEGQTICRDGSEIDTCEPGLPKEEICDGIDNDCDTETDEDGYIFGGFKQPINIDGSSIFKVGRTIPVKIQLTDCIGKNVSTATASISIFKITDAVLGTSEELEIDASGEANTGTLFRYDVTDEQYVYNLSTNGMTSGTYAIKVVPDKGESYSVNISLK